jgi:hypothetical protein
VVFWDVTLCNPIGDYQRLGSTYNLYLEDRRLPYKTTRCHNSEIHSLNFHRRDKLQSQIMTTLNSGNPYFHSVQNRLSFRPCLYTYIKIKIYKTIILPVVLGPCGCESWKTIDWRRLRTECWGESLGLRRSSSRTGKSELSGVS